MRTLARERIRPPGQVWPLSLRKIGGRSEEQIFMSCCVMVEAPRDTAFKFGSSRL